MILLAYHYPPMVGPASRRAASFARYLPENGWDPVVVTVKRGLFHRDPRYRPPSARTLRTRSPELGRLLRAFRDRGGEPGIDGREAVSGPVGGHALDRARRLVRHYVYVPDALAPWIPFAVAGVRHALRTAPGRAVLLSSSVPYSAHLAALAVSRSERVPWIAEFRDPWSGIDDRIRPRSRARKRIDAALEARVVTAASGVVVTSELTRDAMVATYPALSERIWVVRNGFEPLEASAATPPNRGAPLELIHAGSVRQEISVMPLLHGIDRVAKNRPGEVRLRIVGPPEPWRAAARALGGLDWLELAGLMDPAHAQHEIARASAGVVLVPGEGNRQHVAAKLIDYLGARRPIVAIVSAAGEMAKLARDYGDLRLVDDYSEGGVAGVVYALLDEHRRGVLQLPAPGRRPAEELTSRAQVAKLAAALQSVL